MNNRGLLVRLLVVVVLLLGAVNIAIHLQLAASHSPPASVHQHVSDGKQGGPRVEPLPTATPLLVAQRRQGLAAHDPHLRIPTARGDDGNPVGASRWQQLRQHHIPHPSHPPHRLPNGKERPPGWTPLQGFIRAKLAADGIARATALSRGRWAHAAKLYDEAFGAASDAKPTPPLHHFYVVLQTHQPGPPAAAGGASPPAADPRWLAALGSLLASVESGLLAGQGGKGGVGGQAHAPDPHPAVTILCSRPAASQPLGLAHVGKGNASDGNTTEAASPPPIHVPRWVLDIELPAVGDAGGGGGGGGGVFYSPAQALLHAQGLLQGGALRGGPGGEPHFIHFPLATRLRRDAEAHRSGAQQQQQEHRPTDPHPALFWPSLSQALASAPHLPPDTCGDAAGHSGSASDPQGQNSSDASATPAQRLHCLSGATPGYGMAGMTVFSEVRSGGGGGVGGSPASADAEGDNGGVPAWAQQLQLEDRPVWPNGEDVVVSSGLSIREGRKSPVFAEALTGYPRLDSRVVGEGGRAASLLSQDAPLVISGSLLAHSGVRHLLHGEVAKALRAGSGASRAVAAAPQRRFAKAGWRGGGGGGSGGGVGYDRSNPYSLAHHVGLEPLYALMLEIRRKFGGEDVLRIVGSGVGVSHVVVAQQQGEGLSGAERDGVVSPATWSGVEASSAGLQLESFSPGFREDWAGYIAEGELSYPVKVVWDTFCIKCFGFTNEVMHFTAPLEAEIRTVRSEQHADCFCPGSPASFTQSLIRLNSVKSWQEAFRKNSTKWKESGQVLVWVSHKDPGSYSTSYPGVGRRPDYVVGRSMYEATRLDAHWIPNANSKKLVDEIWVPSEFVHGVFVNNGIPAERLFVMPEPIDIHEFDPGAIRPFALPHRAFVHGSTHPESRVQPGSLEKHFKFLSVFKLEDRKGWDILLAAYLKEFRAEEPVSLYMACYIWGESDSRNPRRVLDKVLDKARSLGFADRDALPHIEVITEELSEADMVRLYGSVDAFAMPTRGEGWGLPIIQAMAMGLPTIATNWSGNVDFMRDNNSLLLKTDGLTEVPGSSEERGIKKLWAEPSESHLRQLMRKVVSEPSEGRAIGARARAFVVENFSDEVIARKVRSRLDEIRRIVLERRRSG